MLPEELRKGDNLAAGWLNRLVREAVSRTLNAGPGLRKTQTPSGTTLSLAAPSGRGHGAGAGGFPWRVSAVATGHGGFDLSMVDGHMFCWSLGSDHTVYLPASLSAVSGPGVLYAEFSVAPAGSFPAISLAYAATVPASRGDTVRVPVAQVLAGGGVLQYLCGTLFFHLVQDEEV